MAWERLQPSAAAKSRPAAVMLACHQMKLRQRPALTVFAQAGVAWWRAEQRVNVALGKGDHAGRIRIDVDEAGVFQISKGMAKATAPTLFLPTWSGIAEGKHKATAVAFACGADWLEITLPGWASNATPAAAPAAPAEKKPFSMAAGVIDPVAAGRKGVGPVPSAPPPRRTTSSPGRRA